MNKSIRLTWAKSAFVAVVMILSLASCSSDGDEPEVNPADALAQYESIVKLMYYADGTPRYTPTDFENIYVAVAHSSEGAQSFCNEIAGGNWSGTNTTIDLGEYGTVKVSAPDREMVARGIYNEITLNLKDYTAFTLKIFDSERINDDNGFSFVYEYFCRVDDDLKTGGKPLAPEDSELGDVMWSDGNIYKVGYAPVNESLEPVGIVVYKHGDDDSRIPQTAKSAGFTHGYVMALRCASGGIQWRTTDQALIPDYPEGITQAYNNPEKYNDGLAVLAKVRETGIGSFPAFEAAVTHTPNMSATGKASSWYIPSLGEWMVVCGDRGLINCVESRWFEFLSSTHHDTSYHGRNETLADINKMFVNTGLASSKYDQIREDWYWASTELDKHLAYALAFYRSRLIIDGMWRSVSDYGVRPFLAF